MILYILQNAYQSEKHQFKNEEEWSTELSKSQTGKRLKEMIPEGFEYKVINASNIIGDNPDSCFEPDLDHIKKWVRETEPSVIVACGKIAQKGCKSIGLNFIESPHPAWRLLSKNHTSEIRNKIENSATP